MLVCWRRVRLLWRWMIRRASGQAEVCVRGRREGEKSREVMRAEVMRDGGGVRRMRRLMVGVK